MAPAKLVSDPVIIASTIQGTALVGWALFNGIDGLLITGWLAALATVAGVSGGYKLGSKTLPDAIPPPLDPE